MLKHKPYQEQKIIEKKPVFSEDVLQDERLAWLTLNIEPPVKDYGEQNSVFVDRDAILAYEYAKEKVQKGRTALVLPKQESSLRNEVGEAVFESIEQCRYQRKIILPQGLETYTQGEKIKCLENVIVAAKHLARENLQGRNYLRELSQCFSRVKGASEQKRILRPA